MSLHAAVRLLHYELEVTCSKYGKSLSLHSFMVIIVEVVHSSSGPAVVSASCVQWDCGNSVLQHIEI